MSILYREANIIKSFGIKTIYQGNLEKNDDIYYGLLNLIKRNNIKAGVISGIGEIFEARIAFFDCLKNNIREVCFHEPMNIISLHGNISIKKDLPYLHIHILLSRQDLSLVGGHLLPQTLAYAFEFEIFEFSGEPYQRKYDEEANLYLWSD